MEPEGNGRQIVNEISIEVGPGDFEHDGSDQGELGFGNFLDEINQFALLAMLDLINLKGSEDKGSADAEYKLVLLKLFLTYF